LAPIPSSLLHNCVPINTPVRQQSTQHLSSLVLNKTVDVKSYGADRNGRTLGEVFLLDGKNVNLEMVQAGVSEVYRGKPASGLDMEPYWKAEGDAKLIFNSSIFLL